MALVVLLALVIVGPALADLNGVMTDRDVRDPKRMKSAMNTRLLYIVDSTQLVYIAYSTNGVALASPVTNVIDASIITP